MKSGEKHSHESPKAASASESEETKAAPAAKELATEAPTPAQEEETVEADETEGMTPAQVEAFEKHKNIQWENKAEAKIAEQMTLYFFGKDRKSFPKSLKDANKKDIEHVKAVAKQIGLDDLVTDEFLAEHI